MIVLDTDVVSEPTKPQPDAAVLSWLRRQRSRDLHMTAITATELRQGVASMPAGAKARALAEDVETLLIEAFSGRILPFDAAASEHYASLFAARRRSGRPMGLMDALIAAIARSHGATLATRNTRDFEQCGLDLVNPFEA